MFALMALALAVPSASQTLDDSSVRLVALEGPSPAGARGVPAAVAAELINLGLKAWDVVKANAPVVDVSTRSASALPAGAASWSELSGWRPPEGRLYALTASDVYGRTVVDIRYKVVRTWGGSRAGKGRYLAGVTIVPVRLEVTWGYRVDLSVSVPDPGLVNAGTADDPVAGLTAELSWRIRTPLKDAQGRGVYYMQGDGLFRELAGPFASLDGLP